MVYKTYIEYLLNGAAQIATEYYRKVKGVTKAGDNNQVLTDADIAVGTFLVSELERQYPGYNIIDEEAGVMDRGSEFTWVIDPIDGTSNFANGLPTYGIMVGLLQGATPIVGGIALPAFSQIYLAEKGNGAFLGNQHVHVSTEQSLLSSLVAYGIDGHQEDPERTKRETEILSKIILGCRNLRTSNSAFDMAMVVSGKYGAYLNQTTKIWDNVALHLLVEEAGGVFTDFYGNPVEYSHPLEKVKENFTVCAGSRELHAQIQQIIKS